MFFQRTYKDTLHFFFDLVGGDRIGAVWDPSVKQQRPFRVLGGFSGVPNSKVSTRMLHLVATKQGRIIRTITRARIKRIW
jgi:U3 small nucleolar RNA-associated protein 22